MIKAMRWVSSEVGPSSRESALSIEYLKELNESNNQMKLYKIEMKQDISAKLSRNFNFNQFHPDLTSTELIRKISSRLEDILFVNKF